MIHGAIDGYSRKILYLKCANNNQAATVVSFFSHAVSAFGLPDKVIPHTSESVCPILQSELSRILNNVISTEFGSMEAIQAVGTPKVDVMRVSCNSNTSSFTPTSFNSLYVHQLYIVRDWQHTDLCTCFFSFMHCLWFLMHADLYRNNNIVYNEVIYTYK